MGRQNYKRLGLAPLLIIIFITLFLYKSSLNAPFIFDDHAKIANNPDIKHASNILSKLIYPHGKIKIYNRNEPERPLVYLSYTLNYNLSALDTYSYHLFNIAIHIFNIFLVYILSILVLSRSMAKWIRLPALTATVLFAFHPINTDAVTYIFGRSSLLLTFFYLLCIIFYIASEKNRLLYFFSIFSGTAAFMCKESAISLPLTIMLYDYVFIYDLNFSKILRKKLQYIPFWTLAISFVFYKHFYLGGLLEKGTTRATAGLGHLLLQPYALFKYLQLLIFPYGLSLDHSLAHNTQTYIIGFTALAASILLIAHLWQRSRKNHTGWEKLILFSLLWFLLTILPSANFIAVNQIIAERRMYLSGIGWYLFAACLSLQVLELYSKKRFHKFLMTITFIAVLYLVILAAVTSKRNLLFNDPEKLWKDVLVKYPENVRAMQALGRYHFKKKQYDKAYDFYMHIKKTKPDFVKSYISHAAIYIHRKNYEAAYEELKKALIIEPYNAEIYNHLGMLYYELGNYDKAYTEFTKAIRLNPNLADAYNNLGIIYDEKKELDKAINMYLKAIRIDPDKVNPYYNAGILFLSRKNYDKALNFWQKVQNIKPDYEDIHFNMGLALVMKGKNSLAIRELKQHLSIKGTDQDSFKKNELARSIISDIEKKYPRIKYVR
ncbi:tetratricopeptide repeat protein [Elusimicrobiota bacterium]